MTDALHEDKLVRISLIPRLKFSMELTNQCARNNLDRTQFALTQSFLINLSSNDFVITHVGTKLQRILPPLSKHPTQNPSQLTSFTTEFQSIYLEDKFLLPFGQAFRLGEN